MIKNLFTKAFIQLLIVLVGCNTLKGQNSFKPEMLQLNPVQNEIEIGTDSSIEKHNAFLKNAINTRNDLHRLYGLIYLYKDYYKQNDYATATKYILQAEQFAKKSGKPQWIGIVKGYRASLTRTVDNNPQLAIVQFKEAIKYCTEAKDSLCIAESYEQIGSNYNDLGDYKKAHHYFQIAAPLLRKFGTEENLAVAYSNHSLVFSNEKNYGKAIMYIDSAISIAKKNNLLYTEMLYLSDKSLIYIDLNDLDKAEKIVEYCEPINLKNNWKDNLAFNYHIKSVIYETRGDYKSALKYSYKNQELENEIFGESVLSKISTLEKKAQQKEHEITLKKKQLELVKSQQTKQNYLWLSFVLLSLIILSFWLWRRQQIINKKKDVENKKNLETLTNLLIQKNEIISEKDTELTIKNTPQSIAIPSEKIDSLSYNKKILTDSDWQSFKDYFEKVHPNFSAKLRKTFPSITESEERLFLLLKLNLRTKEIAAILGISNDSVKKNRNRLRKRLLLNVEQDLVEYILQF